MAEAPLIYDQIRYVPKILKLLFSDGTSRDIEPSTISLISLENYYTTSFLPVFKIEFATDLKTFFKLTEDKTKVNAQFRLDFYPFTQDKERDKKVRTFINAKFAVYLEDDKPEMHEKLNEVLINETKYGKDKETDSSTNKFFKIAIFLYEQSIIDWAYGHDTGVISSANMTDTVLYLLSKMGRKGIMSPLDNSKSFSQIYLPAMARIDLLKYLNAQYGFYDYGYNFFVDFDRFYFLNKKPGCTAWVAGDRFKKTIINIRESDNENRFSDGSKQVTEEDTSYINIHPAKLYFDTPSIFNNALIGNALTTINTKTKGTGGASFDTEQRGKAYSSFMTNRYNNPYAEKEFAHGLASESKVISFSTSMSNRVWFTPNKEMIVHFDNRTLEKVYGGRYRLTDMIMILYSSGDFMENDMIVTFKK